MKNNFKTLFYAAVTAIMAVSCVGDDDTVLPPYQPLLLSEDFNVGEDNTLLVTEGWINYAQTGVSLWKTQIYSGDGYAEFNPYQSGNAVNIGWLISPEVTLEEGNNRKLIFSSSQSYVTTTANKIEAFITTDFDEASPGAATWSRLQFTAPPIPSANFAYVKSGDISLSAYSGNIRIGFKVTGSGTDANLDGAYQVDNVIIY
jgi:hypothetical protein